MVARQCSAPCLKTCGSAILNVWPRWEMYRTSQGVSTGFVLIGYCVSFPWYSHVASNVRYISFQRNLQLKIHLNSYHFKVLLRWIFNCKLRWKEMSLACLEIFRNGMISTSQPLVTRLKLLGFVSFARSQQMCAILDGECIRRVRHRSRPLWFPAISSAENR